MSTEVGSEMHKQIERVKDEAAFLWTKLIPAEGSSEAEQRLTGVWFDSEKLAKAGINMGSGNGEPLRFNYYDLRDPRTRNFLGHGLRLEERVPGSKNKHRYYQVEIVSPNGIELLAQCDNNGTVVYGGDFVPKPFGDGELSSLSDDAKEN